MRFRKIQDVETNVHEGTQVCSKIEPLNLEQTRWEWSVWLEPRCGMTYTFGTRTHPNPDKVTGRAWSDKVASKRAWRARLDAKTRLQVVKELRAIQEKKGHGLIE